MSYPQKSLNHYTQLKFKTIIQIEGHIFSIFFLTYRFDVFLSAALQIKTCFYKIFNFLIIWWTIQRSSCLK